MNIIKADNNKSFIIEYNKEYYAIKILSNDLIAMRIGYKWGLLDDSFHILMHLDYDYISEENGKMWARYQGHKFYFQKEWLPLQYDCIYDYITFAQNKKWAKVVRNGKWGAINQDFNEIIPCNYDSLFDFKNAIWASKMVDDDSLLWSVYSYEGQLISDCSYVNFSIKTYPIIQKRIGNNILYGIMDDFSRERIPCIYTKISPIKNNKAVWYSNEHYFLYDIEKENKLHDLYSIEKGFIGKEYCTIEQKEIKGNYYNTDFVFCKKNISCREVFDIFHKNEFIFSYDPSILTITTHFDNKLLVCQSNETGYYTLANKNGLIESCIYDKIWYDKNIKCAIAVLHAEYEEEHNCYGINKKLVGGIVDIYNQKGSIVVQGINYEKFSLRKYHIEDGIVKLWINEFHVDIPFEIRPQIITKTNEKKYSRFYYSGYPNCYIAKETKTGKYGLTNKDKIRISEFRYDSISNFNQAGTAIAEINENDMISTFLLNSEGKEFYLPYDYMLCNYDHNSKHNRCKELFLVCKRDNKLFGLVNREGKLVVQCKYTNYIVFNGQLRDSDFIFVHDLHKNKEGLIKLSYHKDFYLDCIYDEIKKHSNSLKTGVYDKFEDYIVAYKDGYCQVIDINTGETIFPLSEKIYNIDAISNDYIFVRFKQDDYIYIRIYSISTKTFLKEFTYSGTGSMNEHYIQVKKNNKWGIFDLRIGEEIIPCEYYEDINIFKHDEEKYFVFSSFMFSDEFDLAVIMKNGKFGFLNIKNQIVIDYIYEDVRLPKEGFAAVLDKNGWGFINKKGKKIANGYENVIGFHEGLGAVKRNGKWGYINNDGIIVIPFRFDDAKSFSDGLASVAYKKNGYNNYGFINRHNQTIIPFDYKYVEPFEEGLAYVETFFDESGYISKDDIPIDWVSPEDIKESYHEEPDYEQEAWDAMTDGQYGDMPEGFDGDYDWLGY